MKDRPTVSRYLVRKGAVPGQWMIWDREIRAPARLDRGVATGLSEERARLLLEQLTRANRDKKRLLRSSGYLTKHRPSH
jgi:hypothetical protein